MAKSAFHSVWKLRYTKFPHRYLKKLIHLIIIFSMLYTVSMVAADTEPDNFSGTGTNPCSVTINQDLTFTIPSAPWETTDALLKYINTQYGFNFHSAQI